MKKSIIQSLLGLSVTCLLLYSCDSGSGQQFSTKEDSLSFAQAVMQKYPGEGAGERLGVSLQDTVPGRAGARNFQDPNDMEPISWTTAKQYSAAFDKSHPLKSPDGSYYKGFTVDSAGYVMLMKQKNIKGLYLRMGQKPDGSYTIMVLGLDAKGYMLTTSDSIRGGVQGNGDTNFDSLTPCPMDCPPNEP